MSKEVRIAGRLIGDGHPTYIVAEIGVNHNGNLEIARKMIDAAVHAGVDAVKFQKRTPEVSTPLEQQMQMRETPWGYITYLEYRRKVEFGEAEYRCPGTDQHHCAALVSVPEACIHDAPNAQQDTAPYEPDVISGNHDVRVAGCRCPYALGGRGA